MIHKTTCNYFNQKNNTLYTGRMQAKLEKWEKTVNKVDYYRLVFRKIITLTDGRRGKEGGGGGVERGGREREGEV